MVGTFKHFSFPLLLIEKSSPFGVRRYTSVDFLSKGEKVFLFVCLFCLVFYFLKCPIWLPFSINTISLA